MNLHDFTLEHGHRIWDGRHLKDSQYKVLRFCGFKDYAKKAMADFKPSDIYSFLDHLKAEGLSDATCNRYTAAISSILKHAQREELIDNVPQVIWKKAKSTRPRFFTEQEIEQSLAFFESCDHPWMADLFTLGINTGMRLGEILGINNPDSKTKGTISQCGRFVTLANTKNGSERVVPLNAAAKTALRNLDNYPASFYSHRKFYDTWEACRDEVAKNDKDFVFHVCRHTCATRLAMEFGTDSITLGKILGHRSMQTTAKYVHTKPDSIMSIMEQL